MSLIRTAKETKDLLGGMTSFRESAMAHLAKIDEYDVIDVYVLDFLLSPLNITHVYPLEHIVDVVSVTARNFHADEEKITSSVRKLRRAGVLHSQKVEPSGKVWYGANLDDINV